MTTWPKKADPNDKADWTIEWTLDTGDTITGSTWTITDPSPGLTITSSNINNAGPNGKPQTSVWLTGGTPADQASLLNHITTTGGREFDKTVKLNIKER